MGCLNVFIHKPSLNVYNPHFWGLRDHKIVILKKMLKVTLKYQINITGMECAIYWLVVDIREFFVFICISRYREQILFMLTSSIFMFRLFRASTNTDLKLTFKYSNNLKT